MCCCFHGVYYTCMINAGFNLQYLGGNLLKSLGYSVRVNSIKTELCKPQQWCLQTSIYHNISSQSVKKLLVSTFSYKGKSPSGRPDQLDMFGDWRDSYAFPDRKDQVLVLFYAFK